MNNEIKEILEDYKKLGGEITEKLDNTAEYENWLIIQDYFDKLLDYITNLQEENKRLRLELLGYREAILRNDNLLGLQQRIDKAIEIIDLIKPELWNISNKLTYKLIDIKNILKGEDKE